MEKQFNIKKLIPLIFFAILAFQSAFSEEIKGEKSSAVMFTPPKGWKKAEGNLPKHVLAMVVGKGTREYPPSMNLGYDVFKGSLKEYVKIIKDINASQGCQLRELGTIPTNAGLANLCQFDEKTEWGEVRQMHAILLKDGIAYILTASALKDEFSKFYKDFFSSMQTLRFE